MTLKAAELEHRRVRGAAIFLVMGMLLLLWAWGSWIYRSSVLRQEAVAVQIDTAESTVDRFEAVRVMPLFLLVGLLLVLLFLLGAFVIVRTGRRYRAIANRQRADPSPTEDVWGMHRLPENTDRGGPDVHDRNL